MLSFAQLTDSLKILSSEWVKVDNVEKTVTMNKGGVVVVGNLLTQRDSLEVQVFDAISLINEKEKEVGVHKLEAQSLRGIVKDLEQKVIEKETQGYLNNEQSLSLIHI